MEKTTRGLFLAWMLISLVLLGCGSSQVDDSSFEADLSFRESITVGDPESNPSGPYLVTSKNNEVLVSWTEENIDGEGRNVLIATVTSDGRQLDEIRQMNQEPSGSRGGEHKAKFTVGELRAVPHQDQRTYTPAPDGLGQLTDTFSWGAGKVYLP